MTSKKGVHNPIPEGMQSIKQSKFFEYLPSLVTDNYQGTNSMVNATEIAPEGADQEAYISQFKPDENYLDVLDDVWDESAPQAKGGAKKPNT
jgi:hypothetical protein